MLQRVFLGVVDYFGQQAKAYREVYPDRWEFIIETPEGKYSLLSY